MVDPRQGVELRQPVVYSVGVTTERSSKTEVRVRPFGSEDLSFAASLHARSLPHGLFPRLGEAFLRQYYSTFVRSPWAVGFVAELDGRAVGVVVGTTDDGSHYRFVARRCFSRLAASAVASLATRPGVTLWFLRTRVRRYARGFARLVRRRHPGIIPTTGAGLPRRQGVLSHLVVEENHRGVGAGRELVTAFVHWAESRGTSHLRLVTDATDGAAEFYRQLGWVCAGRRAGLDGAAWTEFRLELR